MTQDNNKKFDIVRKEMTKPGNHVLDEFLAARISRRELLRLGSVLGFAFAGGASMLMPAQARAAAGKAGATIRISHPMPVGAVDPVTVFDVGSPALLNQTGEYLTNAVSEHMLLQPSLALSWSPNDKCDVWTFKLRPNVKFHDGQPFTAKDVVATFDRLTDPKVGSAARAVLKGVLSKSGTRAVDDHTVEFHLDGPNGNFPYYVSSDTVNALILPANYAGDYEKSFIGTGPFMLEKYEPRAGASFVRNENYWGPKALPQRLEFRFYAGEQAQLIAMESGQADVLTRFTSHSGMGIVNNPKFKVLGTRSSNHRQMHMRTDQGAFKDKRVRQALALTIDRDMIVRGLLLGRGEVGNDSPFAPIFPSSDLSVPQRKKDLVQAKKLLAEAGVPNGFSTTMTTEQYLEMPDFAVVVQNAAKAVGIDITLRIESQEAYYGSGKFGQSDWLDSELGMTDYAHRGVPNLFLGAPLVSGGAWNAAHFNSAEYDKLFRQYVAAVDIHSQKALAGQMERVLLDETPMVIPYFTDSLMATRSQVSGVRFTPMAQLYLEQATIA